MFSYNSVTSITPKFQQGVIIAWINIKCLRVLRIISVTSQSIPWRPHHSTIDMIDFKTDLFLWMFASCKVFSCSTTLWLDTLSRKATNVAYESLDTPVYLTRMFWTVSRSVFQSRCHLKPKNKLRLLISCKVHAVIECVWMLMLIFQSCHHWRYAGGSARLHVMSTQHLFIVLPFLCLTRTCIYL